MQLGKSKLEEHKLPLLLSPLKTRELERRNVTLKESSRMDPFTQKLLDRTRQRREILQQKLHGSNGPSTGEYVVAMSSYYF